MLSGAYSYAPGGACRFVENFAEVYAAGLLTRPRPSSNKPELVVVVESPVPEARMRAMFGALNALLGAHESVGAYSQTL